MSEQAQAQTEAAPEVMLPEKKENRAVVFDDGEYRNLLDTARFEHLWRVAGVFAASKLVPDQFRNDPSSCMVSLQMAFRLGIDPMMFLQKSYVVHGRPGIEATLAIALANTSGKFEGPIEWDFKRDQHGKATQCTAHAVMAASGKKVELTIDWATVTGEGWFSKDGSKWKTMPEQMFRYRTAMWLIRAYCPEVILGLHSVDELTDSPPIDISPQVAQEVVSEPSYEDLFPLLMEALPKEEPYVTEENIKGFVKACAKANECAPVGVLKEVLESEENTSEFFKAFGEWVSKQAKQEPAQGKVPAKAKDKPEANPKGNAKKKSDNPEPETIPEPAPVLEERLAKIREGFDHVGAVETVKKDLDEIMKLVAKQPESVLKGIETGLKSTPIDLSTVINLVRKANK